MNLRNLLSNDGQRPNQTPQLTIESLEDRMMLSTVTMQVVGQEGGERLEVYANDALVRTAVLATSSQTYTIRVDDTITANDVRIEFINDLYLPEAGVDRNATVEFLAVDGVEVDINGADMFSTGTWTSQDGIVDGFGRGNTLHGNGFLEFRGEIAPPETTINFGGNEWFIQGSPQSVSADNGLLELTGVNGPVSVATEFDVIGGELHTFQVDAYRRLDNFFDRVGQPYATVGVDFYDVDGNYVSQEVVNVTGRHTDPTSSQVRTFEAPSTATTAYVWVWTGFGPSIPIIVNNISFEAAVG